MPYQVNHPHNRSLPTTGQTASYAAGDDGDSEAGITEAERFINRGDGTVYDRSTGLFWVREPQLIVIGGSSNATGKGNWADSVAYAIGDVVDDGGTVYQCIEGHTGAGDASTQPSTDASHWVAFPWSADAVSPLDTPGTFTWAEALNRIEALNTAGGYCGFDDWRLPNVVELFSITCHAGSGRYSDVFPNAASNYYWSSTARANSTAEKLAPQQAGMGTIYNKIVGNSYPIRPVRGGVLNG